MRALRHLLLVPALAAAACSDGTSPSSELLRNRNLWASAGLETYTVVVARSCECVPGSLGPVAVSVVNGAVHSRTYTNGGAPVPEEFTEVFPTVPELFEMIESAIRLDAAEIRVEYDAQLGYPRSIFVDFATNVADEEWNYTAMIANAPTKAIRVP